MRHLIFLISYLIYSCLNAQSTSDKVVFRFSEKLNDQKSSSPVIKPLKAKESRISSDAGKIIFAVDTETPDSIRVCIDAAIDIWESAIHNTSPIYLEFYYNDIGDYDIITDVLYYVQSDSKICYPSALQAQFDKVPFPVDDIVTSPDAIITLNSSSKWNCSHSENVWNQGHNATTALIRAIAIGLGFGSSLTERYNSIVLQEGPKYSPFDALIISSTGEKLKDIPCTEWGSSELTAYAQPSNEIKIYALKQEEEYQLYAPSKFEPFKSFIYLNNGNSIMHHELSIGDKRQQIDNATSTLLESVGWNVIKSKPIEIEGVGIPKNGIVSAYETHLFKIKNNIGGSITNASWTFSLPLPNGKQEIVSRSNNNTSFSIPAISNPDKYKVNINGDIYGTITFSGAINGIVVNDKYRISLELKPQITKVTLDSIIDNYPRFTYNAHYTVEYRGATELSLSIEEDFNYNARKDVVKEPFIAHIVSTEISSYYDAWIDITAKNKYGSDVYTLELNPIRVKAEKSNLGNSNLTVKEFDRIIVSDLWGNKVCETTSENFSAIPHGIYIFNYFFGDTCVKRQKKIKQ